MNMTEKKLFRAAVTNPGNAGVAAEARAGDNMLARLFLGACATTQAARGPARERGWHLAAQSLFNDLAAAWPESAAANWNTLLCESGPRGTGPVLPASAFGDLPPDLRALGRRFGKVEIDFKTHELAVTTETIELEGVFLGCVPDQAQSGTDIGRITQPYRVVALDPHPSARRDDVTHPHVQDERLCEGEGRAAIAAALAESRFYDFFLLVNQVLHTYGQGSAYVELDDWE